MANSLTGTLSLPHISSNSDDVRTNEYGYLLIGVCMCCSASADVWQVMMYD